MNPALRELDQLRRDAGVVTGPQSRATLTGHDPVFATRFRTAETCAGVLGAIGLAVADIMAMKRDVDERCSIDVRHAGAALQSFAYLQRRGADGSYAEMGNSALAAAAYAITQPWPTADGNWFLPHFGISHLKRKVLDVLQCEDNPESVAAGVARWNADDLEDAIAAAGACGGRVRSAEEWLAHPHGQLLSSKPVVEIVRIGDSAPEPFPAEGPALAGIRVLDLTRILAGPVAARTCAEHGADVLMVGAQHVPQIKNFVIDLSHGKRSTFLDLNDAAQSERLSELVRGADVFSQGYRPGVLERRGFGPAQLAELRPGIVYLTTNCFGSEGPLAGRAGWEQVAQAMIGVCAEHGGERPELLPVPACDFLTGYLGAFGILTALTLRAMQGGSYHVNVSLAQSGMFLQRQPRIDLPDGAAASLDVSLEEAAPLTMESDTSYGYLRHLGPLVRYTHSQPGYARVTPKLGGDAPEWLA